MKFGRRSFLKAGALTGAALTLSGPKLSALSRSGKDRNPLPSYAKGEWKPTSCQGCTTWCPAEVFVQNNRAVKVRGNRYSKQNDGYLCPKGHLSLQQLYDPDRIKVPMKRTNPKKGKGVDPKFVPITWDEALNTVADKMMEVRNAGEPEAFVVLRGRYSYMRDIIYDTLPKVFGSPNGISHSSICAEAEKFGSYFTEGYWDYRDYDLDNTKYLLIWGCDPLSSNRMIPSAIKRFGEVLDKATVTVVDPRFSTSAAKGHHWLPVKPGEDGALAVAIAHIILVNGLWHKEFVGDFKDGKNLFIPGQEVDETMFVEKETHGLVKWWNLELKDKTAKWAADKTLIEATVIKKTALEMGAAAPNVIVWLGPGAAMHVRGGYTAMAIHALNGLLGSSDNEGGPLATAKIPVEAFPNYDNYKDELAKKHSKMPKIDGRGTLEFPALAKGKSGGGVVLNNVADNLLVNKPYPVKVILGYMNNFNFSATGTDRWDKALETIPFIAHLTTHASEFSQYADIILPSTITKFEKLGFVKTKANRYATCTLIQPVVKPMWEAYMDETEVPWMLAEKLAERGYTKLNEYYINEFKDPETGKVPTNGKEFTEYYLKIATAPIWDGKKDVGGDKINGWKDFMQKGMWNSSPYKFKSRWGKYKTETHKFEFYSETLVKSLTEHAEKNKTTVDNVLEVAKYQARGEHAFIPHYEEPFRWGSFEEYPLSFIDFKSRLNREGRSANSPWYQEFRKVDIGNSAWDDHILVNPKDASKYGVNDGDTVKVTSVVASIQTKVKLFEGVRPGTVAKCYGQGHWAYGNVAALDYKNSVPRGGNNNQLMPSDYDRLSGSTARNGGFTGVKIEKV
ncbi:MAG: molybdopterin-dependent oxidoreductase [Bacteroidetes bacterium]|nr:molybdopterin-dependent oxidoreductase [Bacteroidota bacterium]MBU1680843.1 molybdopterin-dependent oxidoreductase [Bacteroidota bacterium]MBU2506846.1 molybdopterin-dependent oxidoreductase [Bacteroidota bacterium]